jgi:hypothetical protein
MSQIICKAKEQDYALQLKHFANKNFAPAELSEFFQNALLVHKEKEILV